MTAPIDAFRADPFAVHSARFPLGRTPPTASTATPSEPVVRPWALRGMRPARQQGDPVRKTFVYDHLRQVAVDERGRLLVNADPTAESNTNNDGDEGPSEDWKYDFCPDSPYSV